MSEASGESSPGIPPLRFLEQARIKNLEDKIKTLELQQEHAKTSIELLQRLTEKLAAQIDVITEENSNKTIEILKLQS